MQYPACTRMHPRAPQRRLLHGLILYLPFRSESDKVEMRFKFPERVSKLQLIIRLLGFVGARIGVRSSYPQTGAWHDQVSNPCSHGCEPRAIPVSYLAIPELGSKMLPCSISDPMQFPADIQSPKKVILFFWTTLFCNGRIVCIICACGSIRRFNSHI